MNIRVLWALLLALSGPAWAGLPADQCEPDDELISPLRYLRALSLDLRGELPSAREVEIVRDEGEVPIEMIDAWLDSHAFATQAVRRHQSLLWNNLKGTPLLSVSSALRQTDGLYWVRSRAILYRGINRPCVDEPAQFAPDGRILTQIVDGNALEGYVEVNPYWAPESTLKVCAFDAQTAQFSTRGTECRTTLGARDAGCGCGDDLRWCFTGASHQVVEVSMGEAVNRLLYTLIREDAPYSDLFESRRAFINGPLSFFYREQAGIPRGFSFEPLPFDMNTMPELPFTDVDNWVEIELPAEHAGVLTRPAYLMRFQTNRARAARFYDAFLCSPFQPPEQGIPVGDNASAPNPDLQSRPGCEHCHSLLEPAAAYWGRWTEKGFGYLKPEDFPPQREDCEICARTGQGCSTECRNFYTTRPLSPQEAAFQGMLKAYTFRLDYHVRNIEVGPRLLAFATLADQRLPLCTARRTGEWLLGRPMGRDDRAWLGELARDFVQRGYSYRRLVRAVVTDERYRRLR